MSGIFAYIGPKCDAGAVVFAGLKELDHLGHDSWGIAVAADGHTLLQKAVGHLGEQAPQFDAAAAAIGHTRWATTGAASRINAHPHQDCHCRISVVHNGIIENFEELRSGLLDAGHRFLSDTDTEVVAHLLEEELRQARTTLALALRSVSQKLEGLNAVVALDGVTGQLAAFKNGAPLYIGLSDGAAFLASDPIAFTGRADRFCRVSDGQLLELTAGATTAWKATTGEQVTLALQPLKRHLEATSLGCFQHYFMKEIAEQAAMLRRIAPGSKERLQPLQTLLRGRRRIWFTGAGTSYHAALLGTHFFAKYAKREARAFFPHELDQLGPLIGSDDVVIALSQSGETIDLLDAVRDLKDRGVAIGALVNAESSTLAFEAAASVFVDAGPEKAVISTKSFLAGVAHLACLAGAPEDSHQAALSTTASAIEGLLTVQNSTIDRMASDLRSSSSLFILGSGALRIVALEGALKIKEASRIHAEGLPSAELKHVLLPLIEKDTPCIVLAAKHDSHSRTLIGAGELKSRGAKIIGLSPQPHALFDHYLNMPELSLEYLLTSAVALQLLSYKLGLARGLNPDRPRHLVKSVTVR